jgi:hypothetical protein
MGQLMKRFLLVAAAALLQFGCTPSQQPGGTPANTSQSGQKPAVDQGPNWSRTQRAQFYSQDQGSQLMPLIWMAALKQPDGSGFLSDGLARYGYLKNDEAPTSNLPAGFTTNGQPGSEFVGMTCAACHTRQIEVSGTKYRIDGGPAIADFQSFLADLDTDVGQMLADPVKFTAFAAGVLEGQANEGQLQQLRLQVEAWYKPYHTIISRALPATAWGPSRLDAVGMIFDRLTGLDIGTGPDRIIANNIKPADSPVRYPFLWNASRQDMTQWPGFAQNGDALLGLARNTGEVFGVFGHFAPEKDDGKPFLRVNYGDPGLNSVNTRGLFKLEDLITQIGPPRWQWAYDETLRAKGEAIYNWPASQGGCRECHSTDPGAKRPFEPQTTWKTPIMDVGTDNREWKMLGVTGQPGFPGWTVDTGVLKGAGLRSGVPGVYVITPLKAQDSAFRTLSMSVIGTTVQRWQELGPALQRGDQTQALTGQSEDAVESSVANTGPASNDLKGAFQKEEKVLAKPFKYESRALLGIWATAPYLHNGSVPTLFDLLQPVSQRPKAFKIGPEYDPVKVGLAAEQTKFDYTLHTDCTDRSSGDSNCGHEFGTKLSPDEKTALLEYLKML